MHGEPDSGAKNGNRAQHDEELLLLPLALDLAVRQQVDAYHASNLRMARPHATMSDGASVLRCLGLIFEESAMLANGLATIAGTDVRRVTISSMPGMAA